MLHNIAFLFLSSPSIVLSSRASTLLSADGIVSFLKKQAGPASVEVKADADLQKFLSDQDASVVGELLLGYQLLRSFLTSFFTHSPRKLFIPVQQFMENSRVNHYCTDQYQRMGLAGV